MANHGPVDRSTEFKTSGIKLASDRNSTALLDQIAKIVASNEYPLQKR